jgi:hypothetical protein
MGIIMHWNTWKILLCVNYLKCPSLGENSCEMWAIDLFNLSHSLFLNHTHWMFSLILQINQHPWFYFTKWISYTTLDHYSRPKTPFITQNQNTFYTKNTHTSRNSLLSQLFFIVLHLQDFNSSSKLDQSLG